MVVQEIVVGDLSTNCYLISDNNELIVIDPGDDCAEIISEIEKSGKKLAFIALTHSHFDHVLALQCIIEKYNVPVLLNEKDKFLLEKSLVLDKFDNKIKILQDGDMIEFGKEKLEVIETPGHTPGSISLYKEKEGILFVGDLIFDGGFVGRTDFEYGSEFELFNSIAKIIKLPPTTIVYPGHGPSFLLKDWKR